VTGERKERLRIPDTGSRSTIAMRAARSIAASRSATQQPYMPPPTTMWA
jgi:hypothetical protein